ncbi:uncharacterized protein EHS24_006628 [Apiotrichum porosum]|uniref:CWH43-like N-terminal domain-containing protein n=1 Tax=Apiotrichum porosum TaxID=105984 RepID=A0A427Y1V7_9TREE|nr:uncharacterized protein EHS24_006628 [Apiotrichum porosum]RSH85040.1 hypothetical protein EHS24_006628 [Apiotrichum porosum]
MATSNGNAVVGSAAHTPNTEVDSARTPKRPMYLNTRTFTSHIFYGPYIWLPIICAFAWLSALLALLGIWVHDGKPRYKSTEAAVVFISDIAAGHKRVFIPLTCITAAFYVASLLAERWLRYIDRLPTDIRKREEILSWLGIVCATIGGTALILLAVFDTFHHSRVHWSMTCLFVIGVAFSAIFQSGQVWSLHKDHPNRPSLLRSSIAKLVIVVLAIAGAIAFAVLYGICRGKDLARRKHTAAQCERITSGAAAMEWTIAFILFFYFLTLVADLWGAAKSSPRYIRSLERWEQKNGIAPSAGRVMKETV